MKALFCPGRFGLVEVEQIIELTEKWFTAQIKCIHAAIEQVMAVHKKH